MVSTTDPTNFLKLLREHLPQIIFLDIQMPGRSGLDIAEDISKNFKNMGYPEDRAPLIVFVTAFDHYAAKAFTVNAFDYILKPIDEERLSSLFAKMERQHAAALAPQEPTIKINVGGLDLYLPLRSVIMFRAELKYIDLVATHKTYLLTDTLLALETRHPDFLRAHRSCLLNPAHIKCFEDIDGTAYALLSSGERIQISRRQRPHVEMSKPWLQWKEQAQALKLLAQTTDNAMKGAAG